LFGLSGDFPNPNDNKIPSLSKRKEEVIWAGLKLSILLPQPPQCWDYRLVPPPLLGRNDPKENLTCSEQEEAFSSNMVVLLLLFVCSQAILIPWAAYTAFKYVYVQRENGFSILPGSVEPVLGQLQGVAPKIQISICEPSLGPSNPFLPALLPGRVGQVVRDPSLLLA